MNNIANNAQNREWLSRLDDFVFSTEKTKTPKFTKFCDELMLSLFYNYRVKSPFVKTAVWGGAEETDRKIIGFFPDFQDADKVDFPISALKITGSPGASHRDYLGSLCGLGINRDVIGDILIFDDKAIIFVHETIADYVVFNLTKVASSRVSVSLETPENISLPPREFEEICGTISSMRLDCIVGLFTHLSRNDVSSLIASERVFLNHSVALSPSAKVSEGDVISVRKYGKFSISEILGETKKGRIRIIINKYV